MSDTAKKIDTAWLQCLPNDCFWWLSWEQMNKCPEIADFMGFEFATKEIQSFTEVYLQGIRKGHKKVNRLSQNVQLVFLAKGFFSNCLELIM